MPASPKKFDKDLHAMAQRAQVARQRSRPIDADKIPILLFLKPFAILTVAGVASHLSQLSLAPVYGQIPSALYHDNLCIGVFFMAWVVRPFCRKLPFEPSHAVPVLAFYTPAVLHQIFRFSGAWGPRYGPVITEAVTFYPLLFCSVLATAVLTGFGSLVYDVVLAGLSFSVFTIAKETAPGILRDHIGSMWLLTRCGMAHVLGVLSAVLSPSALLLTTFPALIYSGQYNTMCIDSALLNRKLAASNHSLVARTESVTGYISILDNFAAGYRVMRCDHSLLGGEWQKAPRGFEHMGKFKEPIYAIFVILEAVRLIDPAPKNPRPRALTIGLGIGTSTDAFIKHGIETDIVELDPAVYQYAQKYFGLSSNHTAYIEDAVRFVKRQSQKGTARKYDFIVHDVFTGGAVPASLFTLQMFQGLWNIMADDGVIAVNWAGDLKLQAARSIIETVRVVFRNCRAFREELPDESDKESDFTNMVLFCTKSSRPYTFRRPTEADFLGSLSRRRYLYPEHEINLEHYWKIDDKIMILDEENIRKLEQWQKMSAVGHWRVIRTVVPDIVWENY